MANKIKPTMMKKIKYAIIIAKTGAEAITTWMNWSQTSLIALIKKSKITTFSMLASTVEVLYESTSTHMRLIELMNIMPSIMQALQTELLLFFLIKRRITMKTDRRK